MEGLIFVSLLAVIIAFFYKRAFRTMKEFFAD
jgi:hypothetical protein